MNIYPNTEVHLLSNVPLLNNYNHTRLFTSLKEQENYFNTKIEKTVDKSSYVRVNSKTFKCDFPVDTIRDVNYMCFQNTETSNKWYYAFILSVDYVAPSVTNITFELDVMQTFMFDFKFLPSFIEREHQQRYNSNNTPIINLEDEGLNYGTDYDIVSAEQVFQHEIKDSLGTDESFQFIVVVTSENIINGQYGGSNINGIPQNFYYYIFPLLETSNGQTRVHGRDLTNYNEFISKFTTDENFVGKAVNIYVTSYFPNNSYDLSLDNFSSESLSIEEGNGLVLARYTGLNFIMSVKDMLYKWKDFPNYEESKLLMYPYSIIELTDFKGNVFTIKPENIETDNLLLGIRSCIGAFPKSSVSVGYYNDKRGTYLIDNGIIDTLPNDITIVDSYTASYMQGNKNQLNSQISYAEDNNLRSISQTNAGRDLSLEQGRVNKALTDQRNTFNALDGFKQFATLNLTGLMNTATKTHQDQADFNYANRNINQNADFANENSRISAEQTIGMIESKKADINNMPATISKQGGNLMFQLGNKINGFYIIRKTIKPQYVKRLTSFFNMFGYKVNDFKIPNLNTRKSWNYVKSTACNIDANIPQSYTLILKSIFDKGVTLWHTDNIYDYSQNNDERSLLNGN